MITTSTTTRMAIGLLAGLAAMACQAQADGPVGSFAQLQNGQWVSDPGNPPRADSLAQARVTCRADGQAGIEINWESESGDWTAYDAYASNGRPYFRREIRLAGSSSIVRFQKATPNSTTEMTVDGDRVAGEDYAFLGQSLLTFNRAEDFPFALAPCARSAFRGGAR
jgi:hypothetical protein